MSNIDDQIAKAKERLKKLEEKKTLRDAKNAILENDSLKQQLKNKEAESLSNAREYQTVMSQVKKLFDDLQQGKFYSTSIRIDQQGQNINMVALDPMKNRLKKIIDLQK